MIFQFKLSRSNSFNSLSLPTLLGNPNFHGNIGFVLKKIETSADENKENIHFKNSITKCGQFLLQSFLDLI